MKRPGGEKHLLLWTECLCSPQIHDLTVTVLGERLFRKWLKLGEVIQVGPWSDIISVLKRSGKDTSSHPAPTPATLPLHGHSEERLCEAVVAVCKPGREASHRNQTLTELCSWTFQPPQLWKNKLLLFQPPSLWYFLWQSELTKTDYDVRKLLG